MQKKSKLLYQGCVSTLIYRASALLFLIEVPPLVPIANLDLASTNVLSSSVSKAKMTTAVTRRLIQLILSS